MSFFIFDLDGTLIDGSYELKDEEICALNRLTELGHKIGFASGRPLTGILKFARKLNNYENFYYICANGAEVFHPLGNKLHAKYLGSAAFSKFFDDFGSNLDYTIMCYSDEKIYYKNNYEVIKLEEYSNSMPSEYLDKRLLKNVTKLMLRTEDENAFDIAVPEKYYEKWQVIHSNPRWIEITAKGISKCSAIENICKIENISKDNIYYFGDSNNDADALREFNGIAMGGSIAAGLNVAKLVTKNVYEHGVVYALKEILHVI